MTREVMREKDDARQALLSLKLECLFVSLNDFGPLTIAANVQQHRLPPLADQYGLELFLLDLEARIIHPDTRKD